MVLWILLYHSQLPDSTAHFSQCLFTWVNGHRILCRKTGGITPIYTLHCVARSFLIGTSSNRLWVWELHQACKLSRNHDFPLKWQTLVFYSFIHDIFWLIYVKQELYCFPISLFLGTPRSISPYEQNPPAVPTLLLGCHLVSAILRSFHPYFYQGAVL